ncbi:MAG: hypothetical protein HOE90_06450 [Bacteriovoracaceae bacterium]|jgi:hypothetical protein|nr:hypothetical protein [Bacteriovoracaceae bacterium]
MKLLNIKKTFLFLTLLGPKLSYGDPTVLSCCIEESNLMNSTQKSEFKKYLRKTLRSYFKDQKINIAPITQIKFKIESLKATIPPTFELMGFRNVLWEVQPFKVRSLNGYGEFLVEHEDLSKKGDIYSVLSYREWDYNERLDEAVCFLRFHATIDLKVTSLNTNSKGVIPLKKKLSMGNQKTLLLEKKLMAKRLAYNKDKIVKSCTQALGRL